MLELLHCDEHLVAVNKPSGLLVHRSPIDRHETRFALQLLRDQLGHRVYPVHRLDKPTSGVLLFAQTPAAARALAEQFAQRRVHKTYIAIVRGWCAPEGVIEHPLTEQPADSGSDKAPTRTQAATTRFRRLGTAELPIAVDRYPSSRYSLVRLQPVTGRRHQLRRHMKHISHPIIGDANHGKGIHNRFFQTHFKCHRLLLACTALELQHPEHGSTLRLRAQPGADFEATAIALGWQRELEDAIREVTTGP